MAIDYWQNLDEELIYHIYNRCIAPLDLFRDDKDFTGFLSKYDRYLGPYVDLFSYCLMPNHFHFLVMIKPYDQIVTLAKSEKTKRANELIEDSCSVSKFLEDQMRRYLSSVAIRYNNKYARHGTLMSKRFKRVSVNSDIRLKYLICYIHHNPIHHNFTRTFDDWKYSSYVNYMGEGHSRLSTSQILDWFGGMEAFKKAHQEFKLEKKLDLNMDI